MNANYNIHDMSYFLTPIPTPKKKEPKTVNVTFKAKDLMGLALQGHKTYSRTVTAFNAAQVMAKLEEMFFVDIQIISIK
ncbi:MAG: hypothetical protein V4547_16785 [Bacteroidota bacterium]